MPMNPRLLRPLALPRLLDFAPGAAAAYSLRQLSSSYAGPVVTVRRSSDDAEADFTAGEVSDGTLAAWVGSGNDGFVKTWHDQSGNNRDASQATSANQPKLVSNGVIVTEGGKPALQFNGTTNRLALTDVASMAAQTVCSAFLAASPAQFAGSPSDSENARFFDIRATSSSFQFIHDGSSASLAMKNLSWQADSAGSRFGVAQLGLQVYSALFLSASNQLAVNGVVQGSSGTASIGAPGTTGNIGARADAVATGFFDGYYSELVFYFSDQSANRQRIEGDIAWYY